MEESTVTQEGFPFDEDIFNPTSDSEIKSHFEDLAKKHPKFGGNLHSPSWSGSVDKDWERAYTVPISVEKGETSTAGAEGASSSSSSSQNQSSSYGNRSQADPADNLGQPNLRHTVDIGEQIQKNNLQKLANEPKRSSSAPPDPSFESNIEPKRFTTKIEITPVNPFEPTSNMSSHEKNVAAPIPHDDRTHTHSSPSQVPLATDHRPSAQDAVQSAQPTIDDTLPHNRSFANVTEKTNAGESQSLPTNRNQPQVRHIPIFVEGRAEPVLPANEEVSSEQKLFTTDQAPLKRKLDGSSANGVATAETSAPLKQNQESSQERKIPLETPPTSASVSQSASAPAPSPVPSPSPAPVTRLDPQQCVELVQQDVDMLTRRVEQYSGTSRNDKEYLYLDEMLTRNLIKLDTIEVEGNEQLRAARKNVIRSIQKSIGLLESKIPVPVDESKNTDNSSEQIGELQPTNDGSSSGTLMEVDSSKVAKDDGNGEKKV